MLPCLLSHHEKTGKLGALIHILTHPSPSKSPEVVSEVISPERTEHSHIYTHQVFSAWQRAFNLTYGLGLNEQFRDQIDVLSAVRTGTTASP